MTLLAAARAVLAIEDESLDRNGLALRNPLALREAEADYARRRSVAWRSMWRAYETMGTGDDRPDILDRVATLVAARVAIGRRSVAWQAMWRAYEAMGTGDDRPAVLDIVATLVAARLAIDSAHEADCEGCGEELQAALDALREACK